MTAGVTEVSSSGEAGGQTASTWAEERQNHPGTGAGEAGAVSTDGQAGSDEGSKHAVILVHGMGEQVPMETLRGFVETMWVRDPGIDARRRTDPPDGGNPVWWKPDLRTGTPELSRITTRAGHLRDARAVITQGVCSSWYSI